LTHENSTFLDPFQGGELGGHSDLTGVKY